MPGTRNRAWHGQMPDSPEHCCTSFQSARLPGRASKPCRNRHPRQGGGGPRSPCPAWCSTSASSLVTRPQREASSRLHVLAGSGCRPESTDVPALHSLTPRSAEEVVQGRVAIEGQRAHAVHFAARLLWGAADVPCMRIYVCQANHLFLHSTAPSCVVTRQITHAKTGAQTISVLDRARPAHVALHLHFAVGQGALLRLAQEGDEKETNERTSDTDGPKSPPSYPVFCRTSHLEPRPLICDVRRTVGHAQLSYEHTPEMERRNTNLRILNHPKQNLPTKYALPSALNLTVLKRS